MEKTLLVMEQIDDELVISLACDREELLCGLARTIIAVAVEDTKKINGKHDIDTFLDTIRDFTVEIPKYIYKELKENGLKVI